jgi:hypothetical protein
MGHIQFDKLLDGTFLTNIGSSTNLSPTEQTWISSLQQLIHQEILLSLSCEDFRSFFQVKQERTSSSPSSCHFGHYRTMLEGLQRHDKTLPNWIINIAFLSLSTAFPLTRWHYASQIMLEKGKGWLIENLQIIQLCEADLNLVLQTVWGHRLIHHATHHCALETSQFAIPGQTCNNAVLNKVLFCNLSRQLYVQECPWILMPQQRLTWLLLDYQLWLVNKLTFLCWWSLHVQSIKIYAPTSGYWIWEIVIQFQRPRIT